MTVAAETLAEAAAGWDALDDFDPDARRRGLERVCASATWPRPTSEVNLHCHTFFAYNAYGYSPTHLAVLARALGLAVAGCVDFDCLDSAQEFLDAAAAVGLKGVASIESRVFVPELEGLVVNSPGEPGIAYHLGVGLPGPVAHPFVDAMRGAAATRLRATVERVNACTRPVELDYERDVLPLTPAGNATERHVCEALERRARSVLPDDAARAAFWASRLGSAPREGQDLRDLIRARLLKQGGAGYVRPDRGSFPTIGEMDRAVLECGGIPAIAWLDGTPEGERDVERLFDVGAAHGAAALAIVPDRNFTPGVRDERLANLYAVVVAAWRRGFPIVVGTELNAPGQRFVDDFAAPELRPLAPAFLRGAEIVYGHSALQRESGLGLLGTWSRRAFATAAARNRFFAAVGRRVGPATEDRLAGLPPTVRPSEILELLP